MADFIDRLSDSASLTDILIQVEDWLDNLDLYVFKNWFNGQIVDGPLVERHWVSVILQYDYNDMPDPEGAVRLSKYGAIVRFKKTKAEDTENHKKQDIQFLNNQLANGTNNLDIGDITNKEPQLKDVWLIEIKIPRHFIDEFENVEQYDDVDDEHIKAAKYSDLQAKDAYENPDDKADKEDDAENPKSEDSDNANDQEIT